MHDVDFGALNFLDFKLSKCDYVLSFELERTFSDSVFVILSRVLWRIRPPPAPLDRAGSTDRRVGATWSEKSSPPQRRESQRKSVCRD